MTLSLAPQNFAPLTLRTRALARAEWLQFLRNPTLLIMALLVPAGMAALMYDMVASTGQMPAHFGAAMATEVFMVAAFMFVQFYSVLSMVTARRDEGVLKRLRSGEAKDAEILIALCAPGALILVVSGIAFIAIVSVLSGQAPRNAALLCAALVLGIVISSAAALVTSIYTKTVEAAQVTSLPVMVLAMLSVSMNAQLLPQGLRDLIEATPFAQLGQIARAGWGAADEVNTVRVLGMLLMWSVLLMVWAVKKLRWDGHRG